MTSPTPDPFAPASDAPLQTAQPHPIPQPVAALQVTLGHAFADPSLLAQALTHPSYGHERRERGSDNQRLEFLGDAVLQLVMTQHLFEAFPDLPEGRLTQIRATMVNGTRLQRVATRLDLGALLVLGRGEERSGGRKRPSNLSDAVEAVIGAVYRDAGWETARATVLRLFAKELDTLRGEPSVAESNPKGELQELLQGPDGGTPTYTCIHESGPAHARLYVARVWLKQRELGLGQGASKKEAEIAAARAALAGLRAAGNASPPSPSAADEGVD
ncbi:ribonuclease III [Verrucomicrobia bacterium LW23]|nr:ribonuclease III [Verrucomicrobia bacterium LW23]